MLTAPGVAPTGAVSVRRARSISVEGEASGAVGATTAQPAGRWSSAAHCSSLARSSWWMMAPLPAWTAACQRCAPSVEEIVTTQASSTPPRNTGTYISRAWTDSPETASVKATPSPRPVRGSGEPLSDTGMPSARPAAWTASAAPRPRASLRTARRRFGTARLPAASTAPVRPTATLTMAS